MGNGWRSNKEVEERSVSQTYSYFLINKLVKQWKLCSHPVASVNPWIKLRTQQKVCEKQSHNDSLVLPRSCWIIDKAREFQKDIYFCFTDSSKAFDCVDHYKPWKTLKEMVGSDHLVLSWETCMQVMKKQLEPYIEQMIGSKSGTEYDRGIYRHPVYLTYMQSTSWEMLDWKKHKLESRCREKYQ